ncbi:hypothetical protein LP420_35520 [Massilia sp. B-10]|nr:hypothetical protein LP420_35520 [Massilia sp. B-10]
MLRLPALLVCLSKHGEAAGLYAEIVKVAFARMKGYRITIKPVPWKRGMSMLKAGTAFALYPPYMNLKEEPFTWPYSLPLFEEIVVAVCTREVAAPRAPAGRKIFTASRSATMPVSWSAATSSTRQ